MKKIVNGTEQERAPINATQVVSVYSGVDGACCCGCKGKHRGGVMSDENETVELIGWLALVATFFAAYFVLCGGA